MAVTCLRRMLRAAAVVAMLLPGAPRAEPIPLGQIVSLDPQVRGRAWVQRDGNRLPARRGMPLQAGDVVMLDPCSGQGWMQGALARVDGGFRLDAANCVLRVDLAGRGQATNVVWDRLLPALRSMLAEPAPPRPIPTYSQGGGGAGDAAAGPSPWPVRGSALPRSPQLLAAGTEWLHLFWPPDDPPPYTVELRWQGGARMLAGPVDEADAPLRLPPLPEAAAAEIVVATGGGGPVAVFPIHVVPKGMLPGPQPASFDPAGPDGAALHGAWLLVNAGPAWRLQGIALLAQAETGGSYLGSRLLRALVAGEWSPG